MLLITEHNNNFIFNFGQYKEYTFYIGYFRLLNSVYN